MMKYVFWVCCALVLVTGCNPSVPINQVPVVDAKPSTPAPALTASSATGVDVKSPLVLPVDLGAKATSVAPSESKIIYFDFDSFVIRPEFASLIAAHARFVRDQPTTKVFIEGHTDEVGGREYNLALGQKRADAVREALAILGVQHSQMESVSFGKEKPMVPGNGESAYSKNRRAEIRYQ